MSELSFMETKSERNNILPSGRAFELPVTVIYEFDEARLRSERAYIDITPLLNEAKLQRDV